MKNIWLCIIFLIFFISPLSSAASPEEVYASTVLHGDSFYNTSSYDQAKEAYLSALPFIRGNASLLTPPPAVVYYRIGLCDLNMGNYVNALENFDSALQQNPNPGLKNAIYGDKANSSLFLNRFSDAETFFVTAGMSPESAAARVLDYRVAHDRTYVAPTKNSGAVTGGSTTSTTHDNITGDNPGASPTVTRIPDQNVPSSFPAEIVIGIVVAGVFCSIGIIYYRKRRPMDASARKSAGTGKRTGSPTPGNRPGHHDVFISYSHIDKTTADAICAHLENEGIRCWIAPRDVAPGENFPDAIIRAIEHSRVMVLVYSSNSNNSPHVIRELTKAVSNGLVIIPFRIEDAPLSRSMEYLIGLPHWLDAITPPLEQHIGTLVETVDSILQKG